MTSRTTIQNSRNRESLDKADNKTEFSFEIKSKHPDGLRLVGRHWPVPGQKNPKLVILFVHGTGEHSQRYRHVAQFFTSHGIPCVAYDTRGHGLSGGERGFIPHIEAVLNDFDSVVDYIRNELKLKMPLVIYAHGTGCVNCIIHMLRRAEKPLDCHGMVLSTPSICLKERPTCIMYYVARAFSSLSPHLRLPLEGNYTNVYTDDPDIVEAYRNDPLVHDRWPARSLALFLEIGYRLERTVLNFEVPVLIQHGAADTITPIEIIHRWASERVKGDDIEFKEWPNHLHELHNDLQRKEVLDYVFEWINKHMDRFLNNN